MTVSGLIILYHTLSYISECISVASGEEVLPFSLYRWAGRFSEIFFPPQDHIASEGEIQDLNPDPPTQSDGFLNQKSTSTPGARSWD